MLELPNVKRETLNARRVHLGHHSTISEAIVLTLMNTVMEYFVCLCTCIQVDLVCTVPGIGGFYYPEHLPVLGESSYIIVFVCLVHVCTCLQNCIQCTLLYLMHNVIQYVCMCTFTVKC